MHKITVVALARSGQETPADQDGRDRLVDRAAARRRVDGSPPSWASAFPCRGMLVRAHVETGCKSMTIIFRSAPVEALVLVIIDG